MSVKKVSIILSSIIVGILILGTVNALTFSGGDTVSIQNIHHNPRANIAEYAYMSVNQEGQPYNEGGVNCNRGSVASDSERFTIARNDDESNVISDGDWIHFRSLDSDYPNSLKYVKYIYWPWFKWIERINAKSYDDTKGVRFNLKIHLAIDEDEDEKISCGDVVYFETESGRYWGVSKEEYEYSSTYPVETLDEDSKFRLYNENGKCPCVVDSQCLSDEICDINNGECVKTHKCSSDDQIILKLGGYHNSLASLGTNTINYPVEICYDEIFGKPYLGTDQNSLGLTLSSETDAVGSKTIEYPVDVVYGDLVCEWGDKISGGIFDGEGTEILYMNKEENAYFGNDARSKYDYPYTLRCTSRYAENFCGTETCSSGQSCDTNDVHKNYVNIPWADDSVNACCEQESCVDKDGNCYIPAPVDSSNYGSLDYLKSNLNTIDGVTGSDNWAYCIYDKDSEGNFNAGWMDCDTGQWYETWCNSALVCGAEGGVPSGEEGSTTQPGEYTGFETMGCCGDDGGEFFIDGFCCDSIDDIIVDGKCIPDRNVLDEVKAIWTNEIGGTTELSSFDVSDETTKAYMRATGLNSKQDIKIDIWESVENEKIEEGIITKASDSGEVSVLLTMTMIEEINEIAGAKIYFKVINLADEELELSGELELEGDTPISITSCRIHDEDENGCEDCSVNGLEATTSAELENLFTEVHGAGAECGSVDFSQDSPQEDGECGLYWACICEYNDETGECKGFIESVKKHCSDPDPDPYNNKEKPVPGQCHITQENTQGDCSTDDVISYDWTGVWSWNSLNSYTSNIHSWAPKTDFTKDGAIWRYDPVTIGGTKKSKLCTDGGSNTIVCPTKIQLPFFGGFSIITSLIMISLIYITMNYKIKKRG